MSVSLKKSALIVAVFLACRSGYAWLQNDAVAKQLARDERDFQTAENRWMRVPVELPSKGDPVSQVDRQARDDYWDNLIGASEPLSQPGARSRSMPLANAAPDLPEFGDLDDGVWVVGKIENYRTLLSASKRSVYTELDFRIQHVFGHPNVPSLSEGSQIDIDLPGGTIGAPWGATISYEVHPEKYYYQPGHTYLIALGYHPHGNFYTGGPSNAAKRWDVTDGTIRPGNSLQAYRAANKKSEIDGLPLNDATALVDKKFDELKTRQ